MNTTYRDMFEDTTEQNNHTKSLLEQLPTPILDRLLVECELDEKIGSIIQLASVDKEKPNRGTIVSIGAGRQSKEKGVFIPTTLQPGQKVFWNNFEGKYFNINHKLYCMLQEQDIQAVLGD